jgi:hypothetical protein
MPINMMTKKSTSITIQRLADSGPPAANTAHLLAINFICFILFLKFVIFIYIYLYIFYLYYLVDILADGR